MSIASFLSAWLSFPHPWFSRFYSMPLTGSPRRIRVVYVGHSHSLCSCGLPTSLVLPRYYSHNLWSFLNFCSTFCLLVHSVISAFYMVTDIIKSIGSEHCNVIRRLLHYSLFLFATSPLRCHLKWDWDQEDSWHTSQRLQGWGRAAVVFFTKTWVVDNGPLLLRLYLWPLWHSPYPP